MPHYKCVACKARLHSAGSPADQVGELCPGCGSLLEPVGDLAEIVGFRSIKAADGAPAGDAPGTHERLAESVGDFLALREAIRAQAERDSSEAAAAAIALPVLPPSSRSETTS
jgi:hypothetical protein